VQPLPDAAAAARQGKDARSIGVISLFGETQDAIWSPNDRDCGGRTRVKCQITFSQLRLPTNSANRALG
jgi:hypothetical protein